MHVFFGSLLVSTASSFHPSIVLCDYFSPFDPPTHTWTQVLPVYLASGLVDSMHSSYFRPFLSIPLSTNRGDNSGAKIVPYTQTLTIGMECGSADLSLETSSAIGTFGEIMCL